MTQFEKRNSVEQFNKDWTASFEHSPPLGYILRDDWSELWIRVHSLPQSQRYATNAQEKKTILNRANAISNECFGEGSEVWIVIAQFGDWPFVCPVKDQSLDWRYVTRWTDPSDEPDDQIHVLFHAAFTTWEPKKLDWLFADAAEDRCRALLFSSSERLVLAPYDGGFDIICLDQGRLSSLENRFESWQSEREDRL